MRTKESFDALLNSIYKCKSMHIIEHTIEQNLNDKTLSEDQRASLIALYEMRDLDSIWAYTAEKLGLHEEAETIRAFIEKKKSRPKPNLDDILI